MSKDTGVVALGDVIFIPGPAEVLTVTAEIGQSVGAGQAVATITSGDPLVVTMCASSSRI